MLHTVSVLCCLLTFALGVSKNSSQPHTKRTRWRTTTCFFQFGEATGRCVAEEQRATVGAAPAGARQRPWSLHPPTRKEKDGAGTSSATSCCCSAFSRSFSTCGGAGACRSVEGSVEEAGGTSSWSMSSRTRSRRCGALEALPRWIRAVVPQFWVHGVSFSSVVVHVKFIAIRLLPCSFH